MANIRWFIKWNNPSSRSKAITEKASTVEGKIILWRLQSIRRLHGTALLIFGAYLTTTKYHLDGSLQVPYWDCLKGEKVHWGVDKALLHPGSTHCPKALPISHTQTTGPVQHSCSLLLIFIYHLQLSISSESALEILCKPPNVSLRRDW